MGQRGRPLPTLCSIHTYPIPSLVSHWYPLLHGFRRPETARGRPTRAIRRSRDPRTGCRRSMRRPAPPAGGRRRSNCAATCRGRCAGQAASWPRRATEPAPAPPPAQGMAPAGAACSPGYAKGLGLALVLAMRGAGALPVRCVTARTVLARAPPQDQTQATPWRHTTMRTVLPAPPAPLAVAKFGPGSIPMNAQSRRGSALNAAHRSGNSVLLCFQTAA